MGWISGKLKMSKKPRIALIFDSMSLPPKDGVTYRAYHVIKSLQRNPEVDARAYLTDRGWFPTSRISEHGISATTFPSQWLYSERERFREIVRADDVDIIHPLNSHSLVPFYALELAHELGIKLVCDMHDVDCDLYSSLGRDADYVNRSKIAQQAIGNACDHIFVMSSLDMVRLEQLGINKLHMTHSPNGINPINTPADLSKRDSAIFIGNMDYEPNFQAAHIICSSIAPIVNSRYPDFRFEFVGRTPQSLRRYESSNIIFHGEVDDPTNLLASSKIALAPLVSGSGMKVKMLTYGQHGLPVLGTSIALQGYADNPGFIVSDDIDGFGNQLLELLASPETLIDLGKAARSYINESFNWPRITQTLTNVYKSTMMKPSRAKYQSIKTRESCINLDGVEIDMPEFMMEPRFRLPTPNIQLNYVTPKVQSI